MAARGDAYKTLSVEEFATDDGLFNTEITNVVDNRVDLLTGRAMSRFGAMNCHSNTSLQFDNSNLIGLYYLGFSYFRLKLYNKAREALAHCPKVEGMFNVNPLLLELEEVAATKEATAAEEAAAADQARIQYMNACYILSYCRGKHDRFFTD